MFHLGLFKNFKRLDVESMKVEEEFDETDGTKTNRNNS